MLLLNPAAVCSFGVMFKRSEWLHSWNAREVGRASPRATHVSWLRPPPGALPQVLVVGPSGGNKGRLVWYIKERSTGTPRCATHRTQARRCIPFRAALHPTGRLSRSRPNQLIIEEACSISYTTKCVAIQNLPIAAHACADGRQLTPHLPPVHLSGELIIESNGRRLYFKSSSRALLDELSGNVEAAARPPQPTLIDTAASYIDTAASYAGAASYAAHTVVSRARQVCGVALCRESNALTACGF